MPRLSARRKKNSEINKESADHVWGWSPNMGFSSWPHFAHQSSKIYHALKAELDPGPLGSGWTTTPTVWQASSQNSGNGVPSAPHVNVDEDSKVQGLATPSRTFNSTREPAASRPDWASSFPPVPFPPGQETSDRISQEDYSMSLDYSQYENEPACHSVIPLALNDDTVDYELLGHSLQGYSNHSQAGPLQCDIHIPQSHSSVPPTTSLPTPMHTPTRSRPLMSNSGLLDANPSQTPAVLTAVVRWSFPERRTINCELFLNGQPVSPSLADLPSQPGPQEDNPMACDVPSDAEGSGGGEQAHEDRRANAWVQNGPIAPAAIDTLLPPSESHGSSVESQSHDDVSGEPPSSSTDEQPSAASQPGTTKQPGPGSTLSSNGGRPRPQGPPTYSSASSIGIAEEPPQTPAIAQFLSAVAVQARYCISPPKKKKKTVIGHPEDILHIITGRVMTEELQPFFAGVNNSPQSNDILDKVAHYASACAVAETTEGLVHLVYYLNAIKFASLVTRLAGAGSIYLLVLMLCKLDASTLGVLSRFILHPTIVIKLKTCFITYNDFIKQRDWDDSWKACAESVPAPCNSLDLLNTGMIAPVNFEAAISAAKALIPEPASTETSHLPTPPRDSHPSRHFEGHEEPSLPDWNAPMAADDVITLKTNYNPTHEGNAKVTYPTDLKGRFEFTEEERKLATLATPATNLKDFEVKACFSKTLRVDNADGGVMAIVCPAMEEELRKRLPGIIDMILPEILQDVDMEEEGIDNTFDALHLRVYQKYAKNGKNTPSHADPSTLHLNVPRLSEDAKENSAAYQMLNEALKPVFDWICELLETLLPASKLWCFSVYPFGSYVLNVNVSTRIHRDTGDQHICLVLVISDCVGGELVFKEPGLVLDLKNGDVVIFASKDISHFNQHFVGKRASLVFHTDSCSKGWVKDANGWLHNICFRRSTAASGEASSQDNPQGKRKKTTKTTRGSKAPASGGRGAAAAAGSQSAEDQTTITMTPEEYQAFCAFQEQQGQQGQNKGNTAAQKKAAEKLRKAKEDLVCLQSYRHLNNNIDPSGLPDFTNEIEVEAEEEAQAEDEGGVQKGGEDQTDEEAAPEEEDAEQRAESDKENEAPSGRPTPSNIFNDNGLEQANLADPGSKKTSLKKSSKGQKDSLTSATTSGMATSESSASKSAPVSKSSSKATRDNFSCSELIFLADTAKSWLHTQICFGNWVLDSDSKKADWIWSIITDVPNILGESGNAKANEALKVVLKDEVQKNKLITYVGYGKNVLFSTVITKARQCVMGHYGLLSGSPKEIEAKVEWLMTSSNFIYGDLDLKERTFNETKPFGNPFIKELIQGIWFNTVKNGSKVEKLTTKKILEKQAVPLTIMFIVVIAFRNFLMEKLQIEHGIGEYRSGGFVQSPFQEGIIKTRFNYHMSTWRGLVQKSKKWTDAYPAALLTTILKTCGDLTHLLQDDEEVNEDDIKAVNGNDLDNVADNGMEIF
ncbi:hypothetical protein CPB84DRAFT_1755006 [Gymnopilus junonius]|uniref:DUF6532 domain-containing protein n=1 Tax=Gymnopilus junonius TaxID=109634 RepID=A0A9P5TEH9_GYMJU|nr:hypothetical protein CPB84DRAFT_1755006 [Gymnopilus junonius]